MKLAWLAFGAALTLMGPTVALAACDRPTPPAPIDGAAVTMTELVAAQAVVVGFMNASDSYQECLIAESDARNKEAKASKTKVDPGLRKATDAAIVANQKDKEQVGKAFNAAVKAQKAAHPS